jgi:hypothetical protein
MVASSSLEASRIPGGECSGGCASTDGCHEERLTIHRGSIVPLLLVLLIAATPSNAIAAPRITISIYAPLQKGAPVHIVGLDYGEEKVRIVLTNVSDKAVADVVVVGQMVALPGCAAEPGHVIDIGGTYVDHPLQIAPHGRVVTSPDNSPFGPGDLIVDTRQFDYRYAHVQVVVLEVDFADGTKWRWKSGRSRDEVYPPVLDEALLDADAGKCPDAAAVAQALGTFGGEMGYDRKMEKPSYTGDEGADVPPHLLFSCRLEGTKAICPSP